MTGGDPARELERLPGVLAATLFLDSPAEPRVYLATTAEADPAALRQASAELLMDRGYPVPADRIHVGAAPAPTSPGELPRARLDDLEVHRSESRVECSVRLRARSHATYGTCSEPDTPAGRARAAARATLQAAEALDPDFRFGLQGVRTLDLWGEETLIVLVDASAGRAHAQLPGAALLDRSVEEAAALATLQALRSWLS